MNRFLDKTLSPTLRQMVAMGDLNSEVCDQIENAGTVKELRSFDELNRPIQGILLRENQHPVEFQQVPGTTHADDLHCRPLLTTAREDPRRKSWRAGGASRKSDGISAGKCSPTISPTTRSRSRSFSAPHNMTGLEPAYIARQAGWRKKAGGAAAWRVRHEALLEGVHKRAKDSSADMNAGIEVAVFVVRKAAEMLKKK